MFRGAQIAPNGGSIWGSESRIGGPIGGPDIGIGGPDIVIGYLDP